MNYIVLDLEWNQPISLEMEAFKKYGSRLLFEIIQIGAVKMDGERHITDELSLLVKPVVYTKLHSMVKKMTHITEDSLKAAPLFGDAMEQFAEWCGDDFVFLTWGGDDVSVMRQNLDFHGITTAFPPYYDLQKMYSRESGISSPRSLDKAVRDMGITVDEEKQFHNAHDDAYYTAMVFQEMRNPENILLFPEQPRELHRLTPEEKQARAAEKQKKRAMAMRQEYPKVVKPLMMEEAHEYDTCENYLTYSSPFTSLTDVASNRRFQWMPCPVCGKRMKPDHCANTPIGGGSYASILRCPAHGDHLLRYFVTEEYGGSLRVWYEVQKADEADVRDVHMTNYVLRQSGEVRKK